MVREAEQNAAEDRRRRELVELRNQADAAIYAAEKQIRESGSQVGDATRKAVEDAIADLRQAAGGEDGNAIRQRIEALTEALIRFGEEIHRAGAAQGPGAGGASAEGDEQVVDAEFEDVDEGRR